MLQGRVGDRREGRPRFGDRADRGGRPVMAGRVARPAGQDHGRRGAGGGPQQGGAEVLPEHQQHGRRLPPQRPGCTSATASGARRSTSTAASSASSATWSAPCPRTTRRATRPAPPSFASTSASIASGASPPCPPKAARSTASRVDAQAEGWYRQGRPTATGPSCVGWSSRPSARSWGDDALDLLGDLAFQNGRFAEALSAYRRVVHHGHHRRLQPHQFAHALHIPPGGGRQVRELARLGDVVVPARHRLVHRLAAFEAEGVAREVRQPLAVEVVGGAELQLLEAAQHVQQHDGDLVGPGQRRGVADGHRVEPAARAAAGR